MKTIYKYKLTMIDKEIPLPIGAIILDVKSQSGIICLWIEVDTKAETEVRKFHIFATGDNLISKNGILYYIGSAIFLSLGEIFHVYEEIQ